MIIAKSVIIIASGRVKYAGADSLDTLIRSVRGLGKTPVLVLGPDGDDLLRTCVEIEECEIVFDPNYQGELFSSIKAGLEAVNGPAFVLPLAEKNTLDFAAWPILEKSLVQVERATHVLRPVTQNNEDEIMFPQIVTAHGLLPLKALPSSTDWFTAGEIKTQNVELHP